MRKIVLLGSTGSIGTQTLDVVRNNKEELEVVGLAANRSVPEVEKQVREFNPKYVCMFDETAAKELQDKISDTGIKVMAGMDGLLEMVSVPEADTVLTAVVGMIGIRPTIRAIECGKDIALANKETLVAAGHIVMKAVHDNNVNLLPVDSEHSAIFQSLRGGYHPCLTFTKKGRDASEVKRLILTASGGPFRGMTKAELAQVTLAQCLKHPNWNMGKKVTIDSSTLANKGLEVMEAHWLFNMPYEKIDVVVHPQSIVHSLVEFEDGAVLAQLGIPDMRLPIQYALSYPKRFNCSFGQLDLVQCGALTFEKPDTEAFPLLQIAINCGIAGGSLPCAFNAANEECVTAFIDGKISYPDIPAIVKGVIDSHALISKPDLDEIEETDKEVRIRTKEIISNISKQ